MSTTSPDHAPTKRAPGGASRRPRARRGSALMLVLVVTFALGGLATSAIYLSSNSDLQTKMHDRERDFRYAAEWALAVGKARVSKDTTLVLPDSLYVQLLAGAPVSQAGGQTVPRLSVDLYAGLSGAVNGQYGRAVSLVAVAKDAAGARHVRRLELSAENFARYAVFTDKWTSGLCYTTGEIVRGRAQSNQNWVSCGPPGPQYTDSVSAVSSITGSAIFDVASVPNAQSIVYPTVAKLSKLPTLASAANLVVTPASNANGGTRLQFVTFDVNGDGAIGADEGFFMVFDGDVADDTSRTRAGFPGGNGNIMSSSNVVVTQQCGVMYTTSTGRQLFFPTQVHTQTWFRDTLATYFDTTFANTQKALTVAAYMSQPNARCYPAGDPHLVATERGVTKPGEDSTWTVTTTTGHWKAFPGTVPPAFATAAAIPPQIRPYLWPLHRAMNPASQGVVYVNGSVWVSGVVRGRVTLYASQDVKFIDDLVYATNPSSLPICQNLLGIIAGWDAWLSDNAINRPRRITNSHTQFLDDNQDFFLHAVVLAGVGKSTGSFRTENFNDGPGAGRYCTATASPVQTSGGCINQAGGVIERTIQATFSGGWTGFAENRVKDACLDVDSPPYFPLTGRYTDNEFYEIDPATFNVAQLYRTLQGAVP